VNVEVIENAPHSGGHVRSVKLKDLDIAIVGAGPYGLSAGLHLKSKGFGVSVFGPPMEFWGRRMPEGMLLRSPRVASNLSDPDHKFTLEDFERQAGLPPHAPLPLDTFVDYGCWFAKQLGNSLDQRKVSSIQSEPSGFRVVLEDGETFSARKVVVATGIGAFSRKPAVFRQLDSSHCSHCYDGRSISQFTNRRVAVIGSGQSALESAALLHELGAEVEVIARNPALHWVGIHGWLHHLGPISSMLYSSHDVGPAGISRLVAAPKLVHHIPLPLRDKIRTRAVRPAGAKWLPARLKKVRITSGRYVQKAQMRGDDVVLSLDDNSERRVDHVLLGTGYDVDLGRYTFLAPDILQKVRRPEGYPALGYGFSSSVPGLHFLGGSAARSFGPLLYFVAGTEFASNELSAYISRHFNRSQI